MTSDDYEAFLAGKAQVGGDHGFEPLDLSEHLYDFQRALLEWACRKGRGAIFADCGLGKTLMQLEWARCVPGPVLILTPLAVAQQTVAEAERFDIQAHVAISRDGQPAGEITVTNYEQLHKFDPDDFAGTACDESSILKCFAGKTKAAVTEFVRRQKYRSLWTATAAPNDYIELGTSSEALGELGFTDMLSRFFRKVEKTYTRRDEHRGDNWRFRGYAERDFWRWVTSWSRALRRPSDIGCDDSGFDLPRLETHTHIVRAARPREGCLFDLPAVGLHEQREERRRTLPERCEMAASLVVDTGRPAVCWCHLNDEGDLLERLIPDAVQVAGRDSDDRKEEVLMGFARGDVRVLVTKPTIAGFGLNWQHCAHQTFFPSHSYEQWYQAVRRSWRYGQQSPVVVDVVASEGEADVMDNLKRKQEAADRMFSRLVEVMHDALSIEVAGYDGDKEEVPTWL